MMFAIKACLISNEALKYTYIDDIKKANAIWHSLFSLLSRAYVK